MRLPQAFLALSLTIAVPLAAADAPNLTVTWTNPVQLDAQNLAAVDFAVTNPGDAAIANVSLQLYTSFIALTGFGLSDGWTCVAGSDTSPPFTCSAASLAPHTTTHFTINGNFVKGPARYVGQVVVSESGARTFTIPLEIVFYRFFHVTNDGDSGAGSLRDTIAAVNAGCTPADTPCRIAFDDAFTIGVASPLPNVTAADITVDGAGRTKIRTRVLWSGDALRFTGRRVAVSGMDISGFDGAAVALGVTTSLAEVASNRLTGNMRGIAGDGGEVHVHDNVIAGNLRSGVFLLKTTGTTITNNRIGVDESGSPLPNGASGIFIHDANSLAPTLIRNNVIANNHDFGVGLNNNALHVQLFENVLYANGRGIDLGLDGPTLDNTPEITSAVYDAASGDTVIEGRITQLSPLAPPWIYVVYVYANTRIDTDGYAEGEQFLGTANVDPATLHFTFRQHADLRGRYVDAMSNMTLPWEDPAPHATEFGPPKRVE